MKQDTEWHETCKCECKFGANVCNNKQRWNKNKCRCECKELIDKGMCDKGFIWNLSNCECECDKLCDFGEYLGYKNCKCREKLVSSLIEQCAETVQEVKLAKIKKMLKMKSVINAGLAQWCCFGYFLQLTLAE